MNTDHVGASTFQNGAEPAAPGSAGLRKGAAASFTKREVSTPISSKRGAGDSSHFNMKASATVKRLAVAPQASNDRFSRKTVNLYKKGQSYGRWLNQPASPVEEPEETDKEREEREYQERRRQRRLKLHSLRRTMKYIDSESQMDKYAFYFEGQSYTIRSPAAKVNINGKSPKASQGGNAKHGPVALSDNKSSPDFKACFLMKQHSKRMTMDQNQIKSMGNLLSSHNRLHRHQSILNSLTKQSFSQLPTQAEGSANKNYQVDSEANFEKTQQFDQRNVKEELNEDSKQEFNTINVNKNSLLNLHQLSFQNLHQQNPILQSKTTQITPPTQSIQLNFGHMNQNNNSEAVSTFFSQDNQVASIRVPSALKIRVPSATKARAPSAQRIRVPSASKKGDNFASMPSKAPLRLKGTGRKGDAQNVSYDDPEFQPIKLRTMQEIQKDTFKKHRKLEQSLLKRQRHIEQLKQQFEQSRQQKKMQQIQQKEIEDKADKANKKTGESSRKFMNHKRLKQLEKIGYFAREEESKVVENDQNHLARNGISKRSARVTDETSSLTEVLDLQKEQFRQAGMLGDSNSIWDRFCEAHELAPQTPGSGLQSHS